MPSITFNGVDLSAYGLVLLTPDPSAQLISESYQMLTRSYSPESKVPPKTLSLGVSVVGTSRATAEAYLDSIKALLNRRTDARLVLSNMTDRYWMARYQSLVGSWPAPSTFEGTLTFVCADPWAYAVTAIDVVHAIDADPKEISLSVAGSAEASPVLVLAAGEAWDSTVTILNAGLGMSLTWAGAMTNGQRLTLDCRSWHASLEGSAAMTGVGGQFPVLVPGTNLLSVTGFGALGSLRIRYNARYM